MECRAIKEGWLIKFPEKRERVVENLLRYAMGELGIPADQIAAAKALQAGELALLKMEQDAESQTKQGYADIADDEPDIEPRSDTQATE